MIKNLTIYTDGACRVSTKDGGIGVVFVENAKIVYEFSKHYSNTTNNVMEILAVAWAIHAISTPMDSITIVSDSQYVLGCITKGWKRKKNLEYWQVFDDEYIRLESLCSNINFRWTKGHNTDKFNNRADELAVEASHFTS